MRKGEAVKGPHHTGDDCRVRHRRAPVPDGGDLPITSDDEVDGDAPRQRWGVDELLLVAVAEAPKVLADDPLDGFGREPPGAAGPSTPEICIAPAHQEALPRVKPVRPPCPDPPESD